MEGSVWAMETSSIGCCIWMDFGEQGIVPGSQSSRVQRDLSSGALHVSLHLPSVAPTHTKQGYWADCSDQTGVWPRSMLQHSTKVETHCTPCSSLPTGTSDTAGFCPLGWEGTHPGQTCSAGSRQQSAVPLMVVNQCWSGIFTQVSAGWYCDRDLLKLSQGRVPQEHLIPCAGSAESLHLGNCTFFPFLMLCFAEE